MEIESPDRERDLLPFDVIAAAVSGDEEAVSTVVRHYGDTSRDLQPESEWTLTADGGDTSIKT